MAKKVLNSPEIQDIIRVVEDFLRRKQLVTYGGSAWNEILPPEDRFYNKDLEIPDYDFYSPNALNDAKQLADTYHHNLQNYGVTNWYEWCPKNWGTKWNACDPHVDEIVKSSDGEAYQVNIFFNTAWSYPEGIFEELSRQYPELLFEVEVDEEGGYFWGKLTIQEGVIAEDLQEGTRPGGPYDYSDEEEDDE